MSFLWWWSYGLYHRVTRRSVFNKIISFLSEVFRCPGKDEMGYETVPSFFLSVTFFLGVTQNFMFLTLFVSGILVFSIQMRTTLWHGDYNVLRSGVLLLQDNESFHIQQSPLL
jgi:hypothetical protein